MGTYATGGGIYTMVGIAGYIAGALIVVGIFVTHRVHRAAKLAELDSDELANERKES
jgi:hypothetical protein